jgi:hypothetical protein
VVTHRVDDDLNWLVKQEYHLVLLYDVLGRAAPVAAVVCVAVQARLVFLLAGWLRACAPPAASSSR